ncbi:MAG: hypothetical protein J7513_12385 [Solirubrobacteraceae bacterium]|nr:hypothetical protein [Solirubrobacteraceae bacterium]
MQAGHALAQLSPRSLDGMRARPLPGGRAWCLFDGEHLAAEPALADELSALLRPIAAEVFPCAAPAFLDLVSAADRLAARTTVAILRSADGGVGGMVSYRSGDWGGERCFYAASAFIRPSEQGTGLVAAGYGLLMRAELVRAPLRPMYAVVRTPNPVAYAAWRHGGRKMGHEVEPRLNGEIGETVRRVAMGTAVANGFGDRLDPRTLIVRGAYEGGILPGGEGPFGARPRSGDAELDALFDRVLGPEDALMVVGKMSLHRAAALAGDRAIRGRLGRLGGRRRGAVTAPATHVRTRGPERRDGDRRGRERRGDERRDHERRHGDRRAAQRRHESRSGADRRQLDRRLAHDRRTDDRRGVQRREGVRRAAADRRGLPGSQGRI